MSNWGQFFRCDYCDTQYDIPDTGIKGDVPEGWWYLAWGQGHLENAESVLSFCRKEHMIAYVGTHANAAGNTLFESKAETL